MPEEHIIDISPPVEGVISSPEISFTQHLGVDLRSREIFVGEELEEDFGEWFTVVLRHLIRKDKPNRLDPITVWINTVGGDVNSMFTFHDLVRASPAEVVTIGTGNVLSAGVLMLVCGHKRLVTESCVLMSHEGTTGTSDNLRYSELKERFKVEEWNLKHWCNLMARYTPQDAAYWWRMSKNKAEYWELSGQAIVDAGLADKVFTVEDANF